MLNYTGSNIAAGNALFGASSSHTLSIWGAAFIESGRFVLVLVRKSDGAVAWKKLDPLTLTPVAYDMPYAPSVAGIAANDRGATTQGQFLYADDTYLYYYKGTTIYRRDFITGADAGSHQLRTTTGTLLNGSTVNAITKSSLHLYVVAKADGRIYRYDTAQLTWTGSTLNAATQITESEFTNSDVVGALVQPNTNDLVVLLRGSALRAIKYNVALTTKKGVTAWDGPSASVAAAQFRGSIVHTFASDNTLAGTGFFVYRYADGSTGVVATEQTYLSLDNDRVKAGAGTVAKVTFRVRDGYGEKFQPTEFARFTLIKIGDVYDKNDGALATNQLGPFRDSSGNPLNTQLDVSFNTDGDAICYWQGPEDIPSNFLLLRIRAKYPINE